MSSPYTANLTPADSSTVDGYPSIKADVLDADDDIAASKVRLWLKGTLIWSIGRATAGWSGTQEKITDGYRFILTSDAELPTGSYTARVYGEDDDGNAVDDEWTFSVQTVAEPTPEDAEPRDDFTVGIDLKLDTASHDLVVENYDLALVAGIDEVSQHLLVGLRLFLGEWYLDEEAGIPYYRDIMVSAPNSKVIAALLRMDILGDSDIEAIAEFNMTIDRSLRHLDVDFRAVSRVGVVDVASLLP